MSIISRPGFLRTTVICGALGVIVVAIRTGHRKDGTAVGW